MKFLLAIAAALFATPALARDLCPERPGQNTPPCTVEAGRVVLETGLADWSLQRDANGRSDTLLLGSSALRIGIADHAEVSLAWTPWGHVRAHDYGTGQIDGASGTGDVTLAIKRALDGPDGPVAVKAYLSLPTGGSALGAGDWGGGVQLPVQVALNATIQFALTPEIDAAVNSSGSGRHFAWGTAAGFGFKLSNALSLGTDIRLIRDEDASGHSTNTTAGASLALQSGKDTQFDLGTNIGLNKDSPDMEVYLGIARRF